MAFGHGRHTRILLDEYNLSAYFNEVSTTREQELAETTTFSATSKTFLAGFRDGTMSASGFFDPTSGASDAVLVAALGAATSKVITICRESLDGVGDRAELMAAIETTYELSSTIDDAVGVSAEFQADGGIEAGFVLHALEAETADANEASVNNLAASTNGGVGHLHVTAFSGFSGVSVIIEHAPDDATWATLGTFTTATDVTSQRLVIAPATTVDQYLRVRTDVTGSGSVTFAVTFARRA